MVKAMENNCFIQSSNYSTVSVELFSLRVFFSTRWYSDNEILHNYLIIPRIKEEIINNITNYLRNFKHAKITSSKSS